MRKPLKKKSGSNPPPIVVGVNLSFDISFGFIMRYRQIFLCVCVCLLMRFLRFSLKNPLGCERRKDKSVRREEKDSEEIVMIDPKLSKVGNGHCRENFANHNMPRCCLLF